jgi:hypothetical protein
MTPRIPSRSARVVLCILGAVALVACGGDKSVEPKSDTVAQAPAAATAETPSAQPPASAPTDTPAPAVATPAPVPPAPKPSPKPAPVDHAGAAAPKPQPKPEPVVKTLVVGTEFATELIDGASSKTNKVGDPVRARVTQPVVIDGLTVVPAGAVIAGTVTEAVPIRKIGGQAVLGLKFDTLELPDGTTVPISAGIQSKGKSEDGKDAGTIAGAAAGGALLGRLLSKNDKTKGTLIGAVVGGAAGTGIAAATKGQDVELPPGTPLALHLETAAQVTVQP